MTEVETRLHELSRSEQLSHGLLFIGPDPQSLFQTALSLAQQLVCQRELKSRPCGMCNACKKVLDSNHADVFVIEPEKQELTIEQVREMHTWLVRGPFEADTKIGIIRSAETLNAAASNSLLKILEEPPSHAYIALLASSVDALLPTVRSRLQHIRVTQDKPDKGGVDGEHPPWLEDLENLLSTRNKPRTSEIFSLTEQLGKDRNLLPVFFDRMERHVRDTLLNAQKSNVPSVELKKMDDVFDRLVKAERQLIYRYGNVALTLDPILLRWFE